MKEWLIDLLDFEECEIVRFFQLKLLVKNDKNKYQV